MKKLFLIFAFFLSYCSFSQNYNPIINYYKNAIPEKGVKIKTNIPAVDGYGMPTLVLEGFNYGKGQAIGLILNWYIYGQKFVRCNVSSFGDYAPEIKILREEGKVVLFFGSKEYCERFTVRGYGEGFKEKSSYFEGWSITDELPNGDMEETFRYSNTMPGNVNFAKGIWNKEGDVGLGTDSPEAKLHVSNGDGTYGAILANSTDKEYSLYTKTLESDSDSSESFRLGLKHNDNDKNGFISFFKGKEDGGFLGFSTNGEERLRISSEGNVSIGALDSKGYKFAVAGNIVAEEVVVKLRSSWPDYVFKDEYELSSLFEVEKFIKEKGHLKGVPSAKIIEKEGVSIGVISKVLLEKIEELTLYTIEQEKKISRIKKIEKENEFLKKKIKEIEKIMLKN